MANWPSECDVLMARDAIWDEKDGAGKKGQESMGGQGRNLRRDSNPGFPTRSSWVLVPCSVVEWNDQAMPCPVVWMRPGSARPFLAVFGVVSIHGRG